MRDQQVVLQKASKIVFSVVIKLKKKKKPQQKTPNNRDIHMVLNFRQSETAG